MTSANHCSTDAYTQKVRMVRECHREASESQLLIEARAGNQQAFAELCRRCTPATRRKIVSIVRNQEDADDVLQETLLSAYTHLETFRGACRFSSWLMQIGINQALMVLRKRRRQPMCLSELDSEDTHAAWLDPSDPAPNPEQVCMKYERELLVQRAVQRQRLKYRTIMDAYYRCELSLDEIADVQGMSVAAVKSRLCRARREIRRVMGHYRIGYATKREIGKGAIYPPILIP